MSSRPRARLMPFSLGAIILTITFGLLLSARFLPSASETDTREVAIEGNLEIYHADNFAAKTTVYDYALNVSDTETYRLTVPEAKRVKTPGRAQVKGTKRGQRIEVTDIEVAPDRSLQANQSAESSPTTRNTAVFLFTFQNSSGQPYTAEQAQAAFFTGADSLASYYEEASYGQVSFTGRVFGWYALPQTDSACDYFNWDDLAKTAAAEDGFVASDYDHYVYAFPQTAACNWGGLSNTPGKDVWLNFSTPSSPWYAYIVRHEIGHNLGLAHAHSLKCQTESGAQTTLSTDCTYDEYGDPFSLMGALPVTYHPNSYEKGRLAWLSPSKIQSITTSGTYTIKPLGPESAGPQALKIARGTIPLAVWGATPASYYLDFRQPHGFDNFSAGDPAARGVSIRLARTDTTYISLIGSFLLDTTTGDNAHNFVDAPLAVGQTFTDTQRNITFKTVSVSPTEAKVEITLPPAPPTPTPTPTPTPFIFNAPSNLSAEAIRVNRRSVVRLLWRDNADNEVGYEIYRAQGRRGRFKLITSELPINSIAYEDARVKKRRTYRYKVRGYTLRDGVKIYSDYSNTIQVRAR